jgi:hypothetical protein
MRVKNKLACIRSANVVSALLHLSRSSLPYRTPLIAQFASRRSLGVSRCTITPTKPSHLGSAFLTALANADCKRSRETAVVRRFLRMPSQMGPAWDMIKFNNLLWRGI